MNRFILKQLIYVNKNIYSHKILQLKKASNFSLTFLISNPNYGHKKHTSKRKFRSVLDYKNNSYHSFKFYNLV